MASCGSVGVKVTAPMLYRGSDGVLQEGNWERFRQRTPANLQLISSLLHLSPDNQDILATLAKGHIGYAYGVWQTLFLGAKWGGKASFTYLQQTVEEYSLGIHYGLRYLSTKGVELKALHKAHRTKRGVANLLNAKLDREKQDGEVVFFLAQGLAGLINLQRSRVVLLGQLPLVQPLMDWACPLLPPHYKQLCPLFKASYQCSLPKLMGGNLERGGKLFRQILQKDPSNYLAQMAYIEYYLLPKKDKKRYLEQKKILQRISANNWQKRIWHPTKELPRSPLELYRSIGLKRFSFISKYDGKLF